MKYYKVEFETSAKQQRFVGGSFKNLNAAIAYLDMTPSAVKGIIKVYNGKGINIETYKYADKKITLIG